MIGDEANGVTRLTTSTGGMGWGGRKRPLAGNPTIGPALLIQSAAPI
jgi:hypothetical protein